MKITRVFIFYLKVEIKKVKYIFNICVWQQVAMLRHQDYISPEFCPALYL